MVLNKNQKFIFIHFYIISCFVLYKILKLNLAYKSRPIHINAYRAALYQNFAQKQYKSLKKPQNILMTQPDDIFSGVLPGYPNYQTKILLNSKRLFLQMQSSSKDRIYQLLIKYERTDPNYLKVKAVFNNLNNLFQYIDDNSQDPARIQVSLSNEEIKIFKYQYTRKKDDPVLVLPLKRKQQLETKPKSRLQIQVQITERKSRILTLQFQQAKRQRQNLLYKIDLELKDFQQLCKEYNLPYQKFKNQFDLEILRKNQIQNNNQNHNFYQQSQFNLQSSHNQPQQSLFFQSEPNNNQHYSTKSQKNKQKIKQESKLNNQIAGINIKYEYLDSQIKNQGIIQDSSHVINKKPTNHIFQAEQILLEESFNESLNPFSYLF